MSDVSIPPEAWRNFLTKFSRRHAGKPVQIETYDRQTDERVATKVSSLHAIELDLEDKENPRINVTVIDGNKEIRHILFRPSEMTLTGAEQPGEGALRIRSLNTDTTIRLRGAKTFNALDLIRTLNVLDVVRDEAG